MTVVMDANAAVSIVTKHPDSERFEQLLYANENIIAPDLFYAEVANIFTKGVRTKQYGSSIVEGCVQDAIELIDRFYRLDDLTPEVVRASLKYYHSSYDMYYMVLAQRLGATVLTLDKHLAKLCIKNDVDCICGMDIEIDGEAQDWFVRTKVEDFDPATHLKD